MDLALALPLPTLGLGLVSITTTGIRSISGRLGRASLWRRSPPVVLAVGVGGLQLHWARAGLLKRRCLNAHPGHLVGRCTLVRNACKLACTVVWNACRLAQRPLGADPPVRGTIGGTIGGGARRSCVRLAPPRLLRVAGGLPCTQRLAALLGSSPRRLRRCRCHSRPCTGPSTGTCPSRTCTRSTRCCRCGGTRLACRTCRRLCRRGGAEPSERQCRG